MSAVDLDRARKLVKELSEVLGAADGYWQTRGKVVRSEFRDIENGQRTLQIDFDADGRELRRTSLPKAGRGMVSADGALNDEAEGP